jgi:hypothetical protein
MGRQLHFYPDGKRERLRWNRHGERGTQVWVVGYDMRTKTEEDFVGDENENWGSPPRSHQKSSAPGSPEAVPIVR